MYSSYLVALVNIYEIILNNYSFIEYEQENVFKL